MWGGEMLYPRSRQPIVIALGLNSRSSDSGWVSLSKPPSLSQPPTSPSPSPPGKMMTLGPLGPENLLET